MSWLMSAIYDRFMEASEEACLRTWREALLAPLTGEVLEVGAGTGANLRFYPPNVTRLVLTEPDPLMAAQLQAKLAATPRAGTECVNASVEALPFADAQFDTVVTTLVLCSVPSPALALAEIQRVLRPGGTLVFLEHVAAPVGTSRRKWQGRVEPLWKHVAGNCHVTRETREAIVDAGFQVMEVQAESMRRALPILRPTVRGVAKKSKFAE